ncbi:MAG: SCO family protein [Bacteroidetes bacterium]|nr:SCO family protein [Bacteroidota bacterium]
MSDTPKKNTSSLVTILLITLLIVAPIVWIVIFKTGRHLTEKLPILFERTVDANGDTIYHTIDDFEFTNQLGEKITKQSIKGKIALVNFFFASCHDVCPEMNRNLQEVYKEFLKDDNVIFLSHSVDPEHDSVPVLFEYSKRFGAEAPKWNFLTGSKEKIYDIAEVSYKLLANEDRENNSFFHSENIVLVDKEGRIRGIFPGRRGMAKDGIPAIIDAVRALEYEYKQQQ